MPEETVQCGIYRHYKGGIYEVIDIAKHSETLEVLVIYKNVVSGDCWARPISMWNETVKQEGRIVPRFQRIISSEELECHAK